MVPQNIATSRQIQDIGQKLYGGMGLPENAVFCVKPAQFSALSRRRPSGSSINSWRQTVRRLNWKKISEYQRAGAIGAYVDGFIVAYPPWGGTW